MGQSPPRDYGRAIRADAGYFCHQEEREFDRDDDSRYDERP